MPGNTVGILLRPKRLRRYEVMTTVRYRTKIVVVDSDAGESRCAIKRKRTRIILT